MNKKYIGIGMLMVASVVFSAQAQQTTGTAAVSVTAQPAAGVPVVRGMAPKEMEREEVRKVQLTGNLEVDTKVKALLEEEKAKIKAIREEYSVKIKAAIEERALIRASSTKATTTPRSMPKIIERMMNQRASSTGAVRGTSSVMVEGEGRGEGERNGAGERVRVFLRSFFGGAQ